MFSWSKGHKSSAYPGARSSGGGSASGISRDEHIQSYLNDPTLKPSTRRVSAGENSMWFRWNGRASRLGRWRLVKGLGCPSTRSLVLPLIVMLVCFHSAPTYRFFQYRKTQNTTTRRQHVRHGVPNQERACFDTESPLASRRDIKTTRHDPGGCECAAFLAG